MKRRHSVEEVILLFDKIRAIKPNASFGADIIAGFPTENEEMFLETKKLIEDLEISHLHVFPYSEKEGTPASKMPQVLIHNRRKRAKELRELGKKIYLKALNKQLYRRHKVLIQCNKGTGKTENNFNVKLENIKEGQTVEIMPSRIINNFLIA